MSERLDALAAGTAVTTGVADPTLIERWCHACADGDQARFAARLAAMGLDVDDVAALAGIEVHDPPWRAVAERASEAAVTFAATRSAACGDGWERDETEAFATSWEPWLQVGEELLGEWPPAGSPLRSSLLVLLRRRLAATGTRGLYEVFRGECEPAPGTAPYRAWVLGHLRDGCVRLYERIPAWARAMAVLVEQWAAFAGEFAARLETDRDALAACLGLPVDAEVLAVTGAGDRHHGGREVLVVTAAGGRRVVYKPRSLEPELVLAAADRHLGRHDGRGAEPLVPRFLARAGYGWAEFVDARPPSGEAERRALGRSAGAALVLGRMLALSDMHVENVIVSGGRVVLVDAECLAHPPFDVPERVRASLADSIQFDSLLRVGLLPDPLTTDSRGRDLSGLTPTPVAPAVGRHLVGAGTGLLRFTRDGAPGAARHEPPVALAVDDVVAGMRDAYAAIRAHGLGIDLGDPLTTRIVPEGTAVYGSTLRAALRGAALRDGLSFSIALEGIAGGATEADAAPWRLALADHERRALEQLDVPVVHADWSSRAAQVGGHAVHGVLASSGVDLVRSGLAAMSGSDRRAQEDIVRISLEARLGPAGPPDPVFDPSAGALGIATAMGVHILERAITWRDGSVRWVDATPSVDGVVVPELTDRGLYGGTAGVALFLAGLAAATGDHRFADLAVRSLAHRPDPGSISLAGGPPGHAYAAAIAAVLLDEPGLLRGAQETLLAAAASEERPDAIDWMAGRAGLVLALAAVARTSGSDLLAGAAEDQARQLRVEWAARRREPGQASITALRLGAAHGITGVALAAARAHALGGADDLGEWAAELIALENERVAQRDGVPARISVTQPRRPDLGWCWGAAGFVTARAAIAAETALDGAERHVAEGRALAAEAAIAHARLCCGTAGVVEALPPGTPEHARALGDLTGTTGLLVFEGGSTHQSVSLFRGMAGVGLTLLRTVHPGLPSVLTVDPIATRRTPPTPPTPPTHHPRSRTP